jgi:hypothetical protein
MEHGRRTGWTGRPRRQHVSAHGSARTWQVTSLSVLPTSHVQIGSKISSSGLIETAELNRQTPVFRNAVTLRKQRTATCSNRQKSQIWKSESLGTIWTKASASRKRFPRFLPGPPAVFLEGLPRAVFAKGSVCIAAFQTGLPRAISAKGSVCLNTFLPGSALRVEIAVTHSKQTTATFLPGSRFASLAHTNSSNIDSKLSEGCAWLRL